MFILPSRWYVNKAMSISNATIKYNGIFSRKSLAQQYGPIVE